MCLSLFEWLRLAREMLCGRWGFLFRSERQPYRELLNARVCQRAAIQAKTAVVGTVGSTFTLADGIVAGPLAR